MGDVEHGSISSIEKVSVFDVVPHYAVIVITYVPAGKATISVV